MGNGKVIDGKCHPVNHSGSQTQRREPIRKEKMNEPARYYMPIKCCAEEADTGAGHKQPEK